MDRGWHCKGKAIAQIMVVFLVSIYNKLKTQIGDSIKVSVT